MNTSGTLAGSTIDSCGMIKSTAVVVCTIDNVFTGRIVHFTSERLLDVLNEGSVGDQPELPVDYLELHDAQIYSIDGQKNNTSSECLIVKSGIFFIGENKVAQNTLAGIPQKRSSLFTPKTAIRVEIRMPSFLITGQVYIELWQRLMGALNDVRRFIPVTNALISSRLNAWNREFEFTAVNRNQINCIAKTE